MEKEQIIARYSSSDELEKINAEKEAFQKIVHEASGELYKQDDAAGAAPNTGENAAGGQEEKAGNDDNVVDADYTEVNEEEKKEEVNKQG